MRKLLYFLLIFAFTLEANQVVIVENKKIDNKPMQYAGVLVPGELVEISSPVHASIAAKFVNFGQKVTKDQVLFELSSPDLLARLNEERMRLFENKQHLEKLLHWQSSYEVLQAQYNVNRAEDEYHHAQERFEQTQKLYKAGIVSKEEFASDERSYKHNLNHLNQTTQHLKDIKRKGDEQYIEIAKMKVAQSQNHIKLLNDKVEALTIRSPLTGIFLPPFRNENTKEWGNAYQRKSYHEDQSLGVVAENDNVYVQIKVDEYDIVNIKKDQLAIVALPALGGKKLKGKIQDINLLTNKATSNQPVANFDVKIKLDEMSAPLKEKMLLGMTASVDLARKPLKGLFVPKEAIIFQEEEAFITMFVDENNQPLQKVELGDTSNNHVLVTKGLKEGDKIVVIS